MKRAIKSLAAWLFSCAFAHAQVVPAQMGVTPTLNPNTLNVLDPSNVWVPIGNINQNHSFTPIGGGGGGTQGLTNVLVNRTASPVWTASFTSGGTCSPTGGGAAVFCGGTEGRGFAVRNALTQAAQLFFINGYWEDTPGAEGQQNAQILVLNGPEVEGNAWQQDFNFGAGCPSDDTICALAGSAIADANWTYDQYGNQVSVQTIVASTWWEGTTAANIPGVSPPTPCSTTPVLVYAKNNTGGDVGGVGGTPYYATLLACESNVAGEGTPQARSFSQPHTDQVITAASFTGSLSGGVLTASGVTGSILIGTQLNGAGVNTNTIITGQLTGTTGAAGTYSLSRTQVLGSEPMTSGGHAQNMFVGEGPTGVFPCQLNFNRGAANNPLVCGTGTSNAEWNSSAYSGPPCTAQTRVMAFAEIKGSDSVLREYMSACFAVYVRFDGPSPGTHSCTPLQYDTGSGCATRWQLYWSDPNPGVTIAGAPGSKSGNRGLTATVDGVLLIGAEGSGSQNFYAIPPYPACQNLIVTAPTNAGTLPTSAVLNFASLAGIGNGWTVTDLTNPAAVNNNTTVVSFTTNSVTMSKNAQSTTQTPNGVSSGDSIRFQNCGSIEYGVFANTDQALNMTIGNTIAPYDSFASYIDEIGNQHYLVPQTSYIANSTSSIPVGPYTFLYMQGGSGGKKLAEAIYTFRNVPGAYNFAYIPQLFPTAMNGLRDAVASPFLHDCGYFGASSPLNCAIYATGFDADARTGMYWCKANPCPPSPPFVPIHNTNWVAKLWYPGIAPY